MSFHIPWLRHCLGTTMAIGSMATGCASFDRATPTPPTVATAGEAPDTPPATALRPAPSSCASSEATGARGKVLFVLTAATTQRLANGKERETGVFLGEFYETYRAVREAGYEPVMASQGGRPPGFDPESFDPKYWKSHPEWLAEAQTLIATDPHLRSPLSLTEARAQTEAFEGIVVPGGQGVMVDLVDDSDLHALLLAHGRTGRVVGLLCHAPAILTRLDAAENPFSGRRLTSVSGFEEFYIERFVMKGRATERRIGRALERHGFVHVHAFPGKPRAVRDGNLITSQNPFSGDAFNDAYLAALEERRRSSACVVAAR